VILVSSFKVLIHERSDLFGDPIRLCYSIKHSCGMMLVLIFFPAKVEAKLWVVSLWLNNALHRNRWFPCGLIMNCFLGCSRYQEQHWCWMRSSIMFNLSNGKLR
jgi:hypothetical protein